MNRTKVENFLAHYSSEYYDPVKAHEYYLANRELAARNAGPTLSKESRQRQTEATSYASAEINKKKTADLTANTAKRDALGSAAEAQAAAHAARMEKLQTEATEVREKIMAKLKEKLEKLKGDLRIPENASPKLRAFLEKQNASQTQSAKKAAGAEMAKLRDSVMASVSNARSEYSSFRKGNTESRQAVATERRSITEKARSDLETEKKNIKEQVR